MGRYSIVVSDDRCPFGEPVSVVDDQTRQIVACHKTVIDAQKHRALLEGDSGVPAKDPDPGQTSATTLIGPARFSLPKLDVPTSLPPTVVW